MTFTTHKSCATTLDAQDELKQYRSQFYIPKKQHTTDDTIYLCGNSLGLQPKATKHYIQTELDTWATQGVNGFTQAPYTWLNYNQLLSTNMAAIIGALPSEVVLMNTLTVNLHLMLTSFYAPTKQRYKILIEHNPFPSDRYAIQSHLTRYGYTAADALLEPMPIAPSALITQAQIEAILSAEGEKIALILIGAVNYYTGQLYDIKAITKLAKSKGIVVGYDLAHAVGNVPLNLHDIGADFAIWCNYKYLNSGPGSIGGCYVHKCHHGNTTLPKLNGWWGNNVATRFAMANDYDSAATAEDWQISTPTILAMAAINASLQLFAKVGMAALRAKSEALTGYLYYLLTQNHLPNIMVLTPSEASQRGCQLSLLMVNGSKGLFTYLTANNVIADWREPNVIRLAPVPLYNTFTEVYEVVELIKAYSD